jgi:hypothetical protein
VIPKFTDWPLFLPPIRPSPSHLLSLVIYKMVNGLSIVYFTEKPTLVENKNQKTRKRAPFW